MLDACDVKNIDALFSTIDPSFAWNDQENLPQAMAYDALVTHVQDLAAKNVLCSSFIGDGLPCYAGEGVVAEISKIRSLTTSYTAYQGERSQGSLISLWIYQCLLAGLTGFEAINASMYDRATAICEAIGVLKRLSRDKNRKKVLVLRGALYPGDMECMRTFFTGLETEIIELSLRVEDDGTYSPERVQGALASGEFFAMVTGAVNALGLMENVDALTDTAHATGTKVIAVIEPMLLGRGGLKKPIYYGKRGADMVVGEGQPIALGPHYGGPGLGVIGIRHRPENKNDVRAMPGKFVGKTRDVHGRPAFVLVLSAREQHIRRGKATSNICSNQAFVAILAGAALLSRGEKGMQRVAERSRQNAIRAYKELSRYEEITIFGGDKPFYNELVICTPFSAEELLRLAREEKIHLGVNLIGRDGLGHDKAGRSIKLSFTDVHTDQDFDVLFSFFRKHFKATKATKDPSFSPIGAVEQWFGPRLHRRMP